MSSYGYLDIVLTKIGTLFTYNPWANTCGDTDTSSRPTHAQLCREDFALLVGPW